METKDLMIGDWVQNPLGAKGWVKEIRLIPKDSDGFGGYYLVDIVYSKDGDSYARLEAKELNPIPLTPEVLEKNGFVYDSEDKLFEDIYPRISMLYSQYRLVENGGINYGEMSEIKYVHQLQHALRLCGIDKEIEL